MDGVIGTLFEVPEFVCDFAEHELGCDGRVLNTLLRVICRNSTNVQHCSHLDIYMAITTDFLWGKRIGINIPVVTVRGIIIKWVYFC